MVTLIALALASQQPDLTPISLHGEQVNPRNLLVKISDPQSKHLLRRSGLDIVREIPEIGYVVVRAPEGMLQATKTKVREMPGIERVEFDRVAKLAYEPNDPLFSAQWGLPFMHVPQAWDISRGSTPITVAVIDTGVDMTATDLVDNLWTNTGEIPDNNIDDDGNGYVDDVHGYDFAYSDSDPSDDYGHGTACSTIIASTQDNNFGMTGVAPMSRVMCLKAALTSGYFYDSATVPAYLYAVNNGARIFSCSFYADGVSQAEHDAIRYAVSKGVLPIVAAANENSVIPQYPGAYDEVIGVAAVRQVGDSVEKASFSNFGSWVDVSAPGVGIEVLWNGSYVAGNGTSFACPNVAGIAALLWSTKPTATAYEIKAAIEDSATTMTEAPFGEISNYGFVNAEAALSALLGTPAARKPPAVRYMSPIGGLPPSNKSRIASRVMGRGFEKDAKVVVQRGHRHLHVFDRGRDFIDFYNVDGDEPVDVFVDGELVASIPQPSNPGYVYSLLEASTHNATVTGGFKEAVSQDGLTLDCTSGGNGFVYMQGTFGRVTPADTMHLSITRSYSGTLSGTETETIYLYDWSSWSYPYGNMVPVNTQTLPSGMVTTTIDIPNAGRFVDFDGYVYVFIQTSSTDSSVTAHIDQLGLS